MKALTAMMGAAEYLRSHSRSFSRRIMLPMAIETTQAVRRARNAVFGTREQRIAESVRDHYRDKDPFFGMKALGRRGARQRAAEQAIGFQRSVAGKRNTRGREPSRAEAIEKINAVRAPRGSRRGKLSTWRSGREALA